MQKVERYLYFILIAIFIGLWAKECNRKDCPDTYTGSGTSGAAPGYVPIPVDTLEGGYEYTPDSVAPAKHRSVKARAKNAINPVSEEVVKPENDYEYKDIKNEPGTPARPPGRGVRPRIKYYRDTLRLVDGSTPVGAVILTDTTEGTILGRSYTYSIYPRSTTTDKQKALLYAGPEIYTDFLPRVAGAGVGIMRVSKNRATALSIGAGIPTGKDRAAFARIGFYIKL